MSGSELSTIYLVIMADFGAIGLRIERMRGDGGLLGRVSRVLEQRIR
jgi:hypothetical protein